MKKILYLFVLGAFILFVLSRRLPTEIKNYSGDGQIEDISWTTAFFFKVQGYAISFPEFDLAKDYQAIFTIENLPSFGSPGIYLSIADNKNWRDDEIEKLDTFVEFELLNSRGEQILKLNKKLSELRWSTGPFRKGYKEGYGLYDFNHLHFKHLPNETYTLRVRYNANQSLMGAVGYFYIRSGGRL
jgi:hypothetical protein